MGNRGLIFDIKRFSIHDGPGIRTTVFFKGCPLSCPWCHNPESISPGPEEAFHPSRCIRCGRCHEGCFSGARETIGRWMDASQLYEAVERDRPFYIRSGGGVTFSGGEPLLQPGFLAEMLALCSRGGLDTAVDTSGHAPWEFIDKISDTCGLFLFDLKHVDPSKHLRFTGVDNGIILGNLRKLVSKGSSVRVRVPVVRGFNDDPDSFMEIAAFLAGLGPRVRVEPIRCHGLASDKYSDLDLEFKNFQPAEGTMELFREILSSTGLEMMQP